MLDVSCCLNKRYMYEFEQMQTSGKDMHARQMISNGDAFGWYFGWCVA
jgi:hypothetical protein